MHNGGMHPRIRAVHHQDAALAQCRPYSQAKDGDQGIQTRHSHLALAMPPGQATKLDAHGKLELLHPVGAEDSVQRYL